MTLPPQDTLCIRTQTLIPKDATKLHGQAKFTRKLHRTAKFRKHILLLQLLKATRSGFIRINRYIYRKRIPTLTYSVKKQDLITNKNAKSLSVLSKEEKRMKNARHASVESVARISQLTERHFNMVRRFLQRPNQ